MQTEMVEEEIVEPESDDYLNGAQDPEEDAKEQEERLKAGLHDLSQLITEDRSDAIKARQACGIETVWAEDEEYYEGIDDLNRTSQSMLNSEKPAAPSGFSDTSSENAKNTGSTVFPNITRPFVDASSARCGDMLLPVDDVSWTLDATPIPQMGDIADDVIAPEIDEQIRAESADEEDYNLKRKALVEEVSAVVAKARAAAEKASMRIQDWHTECQFHAEVRVMLQDCAKVGTGILKGPIVTKKRTVAYKNGQLEVIDELVPVTRRIDYTNFYPHGSCGQSPDNGSYVMDRDDITRKELEKLKGTPGYFDFQIDDCLEEGPYDTTELATNKDDDPRVKDNKDLYDIWYYYGTMKSEDYVKALNLRDDLDDEDLAYEMDKVENNKTLYIEATVVNNRIIKLIQNTLDTGEYPYDVMVWQARRNSPYGIGVARQIRTAQEIFKNAWRNMMDNAGRASGPQIIWDPEFIEPAVGDTYKIGPWGMWQLKKSLTANNMRMDQVFAIIAMPMFQAEMAAIIEMSLGLAQEATGLPFILQGQTDASTPDTFGATQLQNNNASTVMRGIARTFDDKVIERNVRRHYTYLLIYGEDDEKGDFKVNAKGSAGLIEREMQAPILLQLMQLFQDPTFEKNPKLASDEFLKSMKFNSSSFDYTAEELKTIKEQMAETPTDTAIDVAMIKKEQNAETLASRENVEAFKSQASAAILAAEQEFAQLMASIGQDELAFKEGSEDARVMQKIKADLAKTMASIRAQLSLGDTQIATPVAEPAGRAQPDQAYTQ